MLGLRGGTQRGFDALRSHQTARPTSSIAQLEPAKSVPESGRWEASAVGPLRALDQKL